MNLMLTKTDFFHYKKLLQSCWPERHEGGSAKTLLPEGSKAILYWLFHEKYSVETFRVPGSVHFVVLYVMMYV